MYALNKIVGPSWTPLYTCGISCLGVLVCLEVARVLCGMGALACSVWRVLVCLFCVVLSCSFVWSGGCLFFWSVGRLSFITFGRRSRAFDLICCSAACVADDLDRARRVVNGMEHRRIVGYYRRTDPLSEYIVCGNARYVYSHRFDQQLLLTTAPNRGPIWAHTKSRGQSVSAPLRTLTCTTSPPHPLKKARSPPTPKVRAI
jgi:hypothetical protein